METPNTIYIASAGSMKTIVKELQKEVEKMGYIINYDWTENPVQKPYSEHTEEAAIAAEKMAHSVIECDILIVLWTEGGVGFHIETGGGLIASIILSQSTNQKKKHIFVVGDEKGSSIFYFHRLVKRLGGIPELLEELRNIKHQ